MEYTIIVATRTVNGNKEFLMAHHRQRGWELPGGKLEANEGPVRCALREFREETGYLLADPKFVTKMERPNGIAHIFTGQLGEAVAVVEEGEVIDQTKWFSTLPAQLAFPNDPYDAMGELLGLSFR